MQNPFYISQDIILKLIQVSLQASRDKDKCRLNGVRSLGLLFQLLSIPFIEKETESLVKEIVLCILKNVDAGHVKVRVFL